MAITIKPLAAPTRKGPLRGQHTKAFVITADASKPAGGYTILASDLGLTYLDFGVCGAPVAGDTGVIGRFLVGTASTDGTLQWYQETCSATNKATDIGPFGASATFITTNPLPLLVIGR